ncbi:sigma 54-interacting transcriptional regulator [Desulforhopalus sp. 52FAK]
MDSEEREFFRKINEAAFANPFGAQREIVDLEISGMKETSSNEAILEKLMVDVGTRIERYKGKNVDLDSEERMLLRYGVLFYTFHLFCDSYDEHITRQVKQGEQPVEVRFAKDVLQLLQEYGFSKKEALKFFSFFFQLRRGFYFISGIIGNSPSVKNLRQALWNNIFTYDVSLYERFLWNRMEDFSTIILGKTGTGKGMAAAAIGRSGHIPFDEKKGCFADSFSKTFLSINLSQYSEHLVESELFGHTKGSFTGATGNHLGVFSRCSPYGAIFLDEIGEVSVTLQIKLLQVIQERLFSPVGSHETHKFQGRVIAATNQPLEKLRAEGTFRDDFYYRLCSDTIYLPSLKKRLDEYPGELKEILTAMLGRILGHSSKALTREITEQIHRSVPPDYNWPGNIRELEQCVRQMLLKRSYTWEVSQETRERVTEFQQHFMEGRFSANQMLSSYCTHLYQIHKTYEKVAQLTQLDRRTVKRYIDMAFS